MSYKCLDCGEVFDEPKKWKEYRGEFWGTPAYEEMVGCPHCEGDFGEMVICEICGEEHLDDELNFGVCDKCIEARRYDVDMCNKIGENDTEKIELNCFLASMFDAAEIELILFNALKEAQKKEKVDCIKFINQDISWFAERLAEEVKKNENTKN